MPWGSWVNELPTEFFMVVHLAAFAVGATFAWFALRRELTLLGLGFSLFAAATGSAKPAWASWSRRHSTTRVASAVPGLAPDLLVEEAS